MVWRLPDPFFYKPNIRNAGDFLIACATFQLFGWVGIDYQLVDERSFDPAGKTVIFGGGGNLVEGRFEARVFLEKCHRTAAKLVVLPHTVSGHADLLEAFGPNVDLFAREEISFEYAKRVAPHANVMIADDLAFMLNADEMLAVDWTRPLRGIRIKQLVRRELMLLREAVCRRVGRRSLSCFRTDRERTAQKIPGSNVDLSKLFKCGTARNKFNSAICFVGCCLSRAARLCPPQFCYETLSEGWSQ